MKTDEFETKMATFLSWLSDIGVKINSKAQLVDLRSDSPRGRGRGVGVSPFLELYPAITTSIHRLVVLSGTAKDSAPAILQVNELNSC
jgi:hypothetical protein